MKKTFLILILFLIGISFFEAKAQSCPDGYNFVEVATSYPVWNEQTQDYQNCLIVVRYCYKVESNGSVSLILNNVLVEDGCWSDYDFNNSQFKAWLRNYIFDDYFKNKATNIPACPNNEIVTVYKQSACMTFVYEYHPIHGTTHKLVNCGSTDYCVYQYSVCYLFAFQPPVLQSTRISSEISGNPECINSPLYVGGNTCVLFCD